MEEVFMKMAFDLSSKVPPLFADIAKVFSGELDCSRETLDIYSKDRSPYTVVPQAIFFPKNVSDIKHALSFAREYSMPLTVRGFGKGSSGGALSEGIILDMTRYFTTIRQISMTENIVTVDAGVSLSHLAAKLDGWGFELPPLLRTEEETTIGALFATRSVTPFSFYHGSIREWVESVTVVVDNGEEHKIGDGITPSGRLLGIYQSIFPILSEDGAFIRAAKPLNQEDASGYHLWNTSIGPRQLIDQLAGSEGTLGIITTLTLRLAPKRAHSASLFIPTSHDLLPHTIEALKESGAEGLFLYDETFKDLTNRYHPGLLPITKEEPYVVVALYKNTDIGRLHDMVRHFLKISPVEDHCIKNYDSDEKALRIMTSEFLQDLISQYGKGSQVPMTIGQGAIVRAHEVYPYITDVAAYLESSGRASVISGYIGSGHISVTTLLDPHSRLYGTHVSRHNEELLSIVKKYKGGISASSGDGIARTPYLSYCYNDTMMQIFKKVKYAFDPLTILNPGKKLGTTTEYLSRHLSVPTIKIEMP
jgi:FAD/FMN-containing dehydrogenase